MNSTLIILIQGLLVTVFAGLKGLLSGVPEAVTALNLLENRINQTLTALGDADPDNKAQLREIWLNNFVNQDLTDFSDDFIAAKLELIEDENAREGLRHLAPEVIGMIRLLSDDNPNNQEQIRTAWADFVASAETKGVVFDRILSPGMDALADKIRGEG
jgi:hypothetical protein